MREVSLGPRPASEREMVPPGGEYYQALTTIDAFAFRRMLDRVFWHPEPEVLRFEVRANPSPLGSIYDVVALVSDAGEAWFNRDLIPGRWDYVAFSEIGWGIGKLYRQEAIDADRIREEDGSAVGGGPMPDFTHLQDPAERERYRWALINHLRKHGRSG